MLPLGIIFLLIGICLAALNRQIAQALAGRRQRHFADDFFHSVVRQNIAIVGGAFIFGALLLFFLY